MGRRPSLALGVWLASQSPIARSGLVLAAIGALGSIVVVTLSENPRAAARVPWFTAEVVAWAAGMTVAFGGALHALRRDRDEGVVALVRTRGLGAVPYLQGRVAGLALVVAAAVALPTLVAGAAATSLGRPVWLAVQTTLGGLAYAVAFAATLAPLTLAALSARTRAGGYAALLAALALPEAASPWTAGLLPRGWGELTSIPAALAAVGATFASPAAAVHAARAAAGLLAVVAVSLVVVAARLPAAETRSGA